ncbi:hypothetical protein [Clostridium tetanomorphum]|uniref:hypothetical protein n=1 Tax=Clostridium tetanomorphum TaxID=1553 RepID=UPI000D9F0D85|nr:hypothetical protein [Clostridium tetanomorphum]SQC01769.1 Uncharacterised protein [Clostridium tetanomorphum]
MINASNDTFIETLPKNDVIMLYDKKGENYIKVFYQLFNNRDLDNCDLQLKEFIYGNIPIPKNYLGTLFLVKKLFLNNQISYECIDIKNGKINEYKFELYSFKEENKFLHKIYSDINNTALKNIN